MVKQHCLDIDVFACEQEWTNICTCGELPENTLSLYQDPKHFCGGQYFINHFFSDNDLLEKLKVENSLMEMCSGPGYIGYFLAHKFNLQQAIFVDINPEVEEGHTKTKDMFDFSVQFHLSNALNDYTGPKVDLIMAAPPHVVTEEHYNDVAQLLPEWFPEEEQGKLILLDEGFQFHKDFCRDAHKFLNDNGKIAFCFFNEIGISRDDLQNAFPNNGSDYTFEFITHPEWDEDGYLENEDDPHKAAFVLIATRK